MRFLHVSDVRLGMTPESEKSWGRQRAEEFKETFQKVVDKAVEAGCDLLLLSGSLFCHQPVSAELAELNRMFAAAPALHVVIVAGTKDPLRKNAPARSFQWAPNVHYVAEEGLKKLSFPAIHTNVYAASCETAAGFCAAELLREYRKTYQAEAEKEAEAAAVKILLAAADEKKLLAEKEAEAGGALQTAPGGVGGMAADFADFSYAALGGADCRTEIIPKKVCFPGVLEPASMAEAGEHGVYLGEISETSGKLTGLTFEPAAAAAYVPLLANIDEKTGAEELYTLLCGEMEKRGRQNIYRLRLLGKRDPDVEFDFAKLKKEFRIAEIVDETEPQYDFSALFAEHPQDMIGFYISTLKKRENELSELEKKAMYYGIHALLKTADRKS